MTRKRKPKNPDWSFQGVTLLVGDVLARLVDIPDESVDCVVTSPPYWGLRDYGVDGQIGLERYLEEHIDLMVAVFREVRRVLKPSGTCFVNYGDSYAAAPNGRSAADVKAAGRDDRTFRDKPFSTVGAVCAEARPSTAKRGANARNKQSAKPPSKRIMAGGYMKPKDLCLMPERFAIAMQDDGWWVRSKITWAKPNPMPESTYDRPSNAHEMIWMFTKSDLGGDWWYATDAGTISADPDLSEQLFNAKGEARKRWHRMDYYYNAEAVRRPTSKSTHARLAQDVMQQIGSDRANGGQKTNGKMKAVARKGGGTKGPCPIRVKDNASFDSALALPVSSRNLRTYEPPPDQVWVMATASFKEAHFATFPPELVERCLLAGCPDGGHVLDIFGGAGTTGLVAMAMGRSCTLIELNPDYAVIARQRIEGAWMGSAEKTWAAARVADKPDSNGALFDWALENGAEANV